jgi:hypothetical protein
MNGFERARLQPCRTELQSSRLEPLQNPGLKPNSFMAPYGTVSLRSPVPEGMGWAVIFQSKLL